MNIVYEILPFAGVLELAEEKERLSEASFLEQVLQDYVLKVPGLVYNKIRRQWREFW